MPRPKPWWFILIFIPFANWCSFQEICGVRWRCICICRVMTICVLRVSSHSPNDLLNLQISHISVCFLTSLLLQSLICRLLLFFLEVLEQLTLNQLLLVVFERFSMLCVDLEHEAVHNEPGYLTSSLCAARCNIQSYFARFLCLLVWLNLSNRCENYI